MIIDNFTHNKARDTYIGEIKTLTLHRGKVTFRPTQGKNSKGPNYRITVDSAPGAVELGAAWKRTSAAGRQFLSVRLSDPALSHPLSAALMPAEDGTGAILIWSPPTKRRAKESPKNKYFNFSACIGCSVGEDRSNRFNSFWVSPKDA